MEGEQVLRILQTVVAPVSMISGVGMLVLSMTNRFSHAQDRLRHLADARRSVHRDDTQRVAIQIQILRRRLHRLLQAITLALCSVLLTALVISALFANELLGTSLRGMVVSLFAFSLLALVIALVLFIDDMRMSLAALDEELNQVGPPGAVEK